MKPNHFTAILITRFLISRCSAFCFLAAAGTLVSPMISWGIDDAIIELEQQLNAATRAGRYREAEQIGKRMVEVARREFASDPTNEAAALADLAGLYSEMRRFPEVEPLAKKALELYTRVRGPDSVELATPLQNLAAACWSQGRYRESEQMYRRAWRLWQNEYGPNDDKVADCIDGVATALSDSGLYAETEPLYRRVLQIRLQNHGKTHWSVARTIQHIAELSADQARLDDAIQWYQQAVKIYEQIEGAEASQATALMSLSHISMRIQNWQDAERFHKESKRLFTKAFGGEHPYIQADDALVNIYFAQERYSDAEAELQRVLKYRQKYFGPDSIEVGACYFNYGRIASSLKRPGEAYDHLSRAIEIYSRAERETKPLMDCYVLRAGLVIALPEHRTWEADLLKAVELAESIRADIAGSEHERGESFQDLQSVYRLAASMLIQTGQVERGFEISELNRSRTLVEQMLTAHVDLLVGLPQQQADQLRQAQVQAETEVATLESQIESLAGRADLSQTERAQQLAPLVEKLATARRRSIDAHAAIRSASPRYRESLKNSEPVPLASLRSWLADQHALLLYFMLNETTSELVSLDGSSEALDFHSYELTPDQAASLGVESGALTRHHIKKVMMDPADGLLPQLSKPESGDKPEARLEALWNLLIPEKLRERIVKGEYKRLIIVPDGALALLPFEALVVNRGETPKRLIDVGPPINCAPSATILYHLARGKQGAPSAAEPVLAVGDPAYGTASQQLGGLDQARQSRYGSLLKRLPFSGREAHWVAEVYKTNGIPSVLLRASQATEGNVRAHLSGRRIIHLACHGLVDQSYGNFFGGLALAPGARSPMLASDNGLLTLNEICQLDLRGCELAMLSACETNYGPEQYGEGVWALTRGFLVGGCRRVVASNWLVDDEAAASLVSYYCAILARDEKLGKPLDYASALVEAKRWVQQQPKWRHPFYWATFVLVGPN